MIAAVLDHLWQSTLFVAAAGLLTLFLKTNSAGVRYAIWLAASLKFLLPLALLITVGHVLSRTLSSPSAAPRLIQTLGDATEPFSGGVGFAMPATHTWDRASASVLATVWFLGCALICARWAGQWFKLRKVVRAAVPSPIRAPVPVLSSPSQLEPGLVGVLSPVLLLPAGIADQLSPDELDAVVAHEVCHLLRRDNFTAVLHMVVEALFWFYPLVWWLETKLIAEREHACDESVVAEGRDPKIYAESILKVCKFYVQSPLACASGVSGADLKKRIDEIMWNSVKAPLSLPKKLMLGAAGAVAVSIPLLIGLTMAPAMAPAFAQVQATPATPSPGTEAALRTFINGQEKGNPTYDLMTPQLADTVRKAPTQDRGALKSLTFRGLFDGLDIYEAQYEKAKITWVIGPLTLDGKISTLGFQTAIERAPGTESSASPGVQQALHRLLDGRYRGEVPFDLLGDAIAARLRQGRTPLGEGSDTLKALGPVQSLTFLKVDAMGNDRYLAVYPHGHATWVIPPLVNGKVDNLLWGDVLIDNAPSHPGTEGAVRRFVDVAQNGGPDYSQMPPARAAAEKRTDGALKQFGIIKSLTFKGGSNNDSDVYEAVFANGTANFIVMTDKNGEMQVMSTLGSDN